LKRNIRRKGKKVEEPIEDIIEPSVTVSRAGRARKRGLFYDEVLLNSWAN
jgi:hypothetical protein